VEAALTWFGDADPALEALLRGLGWGVHRSLCVITSRLAVMDLEGMGGEKVEYGPWRPPPTARSSS